MRLLNALFLLIFLLSSFAKANIKSANDYENKLKILLQTLDHTEFTAVLNTLMTDPTHELREALSEKIKDISLLKKEDTKDNLIGVGEILSDILRALIVIGSQDNLDQLVDFKFWVNVNMLKEPLPELLLKTISTLAEVKPNKLPSINELIQDHSHAFVVRDPRRNYESALKRTKKFFATMKEKVIEQDEILHDLQSLFLRDIMRADQRLAPEVFYLMGLPSTGKDTIAETYVDALWNEEGAHEEHLFHMTIRSKDEVWSYLGSGKGYANSEDLPAFLRFLVAHSNGKYALQNIKNARGKNQTIIVKETNDFKRLTATSPTKAVVFVNETHNIPKEVKDNFLKQAIELGVFPITNPGSTKNAVSKIKVPVTFIFASNEGTILIEPREKNGTRIGLPLSHKKLQENYNRVKDDKEKLKQAILAHNGEKNNPIQAGQPGTSEEFLSRIPHTRIHMMNPISPNGLKKILRLLENTVMSQLKKTAGDLGQFDIALSDELVEFLVDYNAVPSDGARRLKDHFESYVRRPLEESFLQRRIHSKTEKITINIGLKAYKNNVKSLTFDVFETARDEIATKPTYRFTRLIRRTLRDIPKPPITNEDIQRIVALREKITSEVFGVEHIVDKLIQSILSTEAESRDSSNVRAATVLAFLGKTSTGKTETAKQYVWARYGTDEAPFVIDFSGIKDIQAMKAKVLGTVDSRNNAIASDFMKAYDRANGKIAFTFDEVANAPKELLKGLYEVLREPTVTGFSDGLPRPMINVSIILTGNAGEQIYNNIPTHLPSRVYAYAMDAVFKLFIKNENLQNKILKQTFPEALLARLGRNIYHFGPFTNKSKRQVTQLKLLQGLKRLLPTPSERGWNIQFASEKDLLSVFNMIEMEGYNHSYQGASIDKFVKEGIIDAIKAALLTAEVENNSHVVLSLGELVKNSKSSIEPPYRILTLTLEDKSLEVKVELQRVVDDLPQAKIFRLLTNYHEIGHEIVSHYYFHEFIEPDVLKSLPGVSITNGEFVIYSGIHMTDYKQSIVSNKEEALRQIAVHVGGYMAEQMVSAGNYHQAGKFNDTKSASAMIYEAVLVWGLSERWGTRALPETGSISDYVDKFLSEADKKLLAEITKNWIAEAEAMARVAIVSNLEGAFYDLSIALAKDGELNGEQIKEIYSRTGFVYNDTQRVNDDFNPIASYDELHSILSPARETFNQKYNFNQVNANFYGNTFNELSKESVTWFWRKLERYKKWTDLNNHEKLMAQVIISGMFEIKSIYPKVSSDRYALKNVINSDQKLLEIAEDEKKGILDVSKFNLMSCRTVL